MNAKVFATISDTHGLHSEVPSLNREVDFVIHSGDFSFVASQSDHNSFMNWFSKIPAKHRILIAGNHDVYLAHDGVVDVYKELPKGYLKPEDLGITLLDPYDVVEIDGFNFLSFSYTQGLLSEFHKNARGFVLSSYTCDADLLDLHSKVEKKLANLPDNPLIVVSHGPPNGIMSLSSTIRGLNPTSKTHPAVWVFGHFHEYGGCVDLSREYPCVNGAFVGPTLRKREGGDFIYFKAGQDGNVVLF